MQKKVKLGSGIFYIPKACVDDGYTGETTILINAKTITIVHPGADLEDVVQSLKVVLQDVHIRLRSEKKAKGFKNRKSK